jgi:hypothetical protein
MHKLLLEALRHREQEILRYLAILGPAIGGFVWLLTLVPPPKIGPFIVCTVAVLLSLFLGAIYSLALGYNYRYITLELAKLETLLHIKDAMLKGWPKSRKDFLARYKLLSGIPWCTPPEVIKVFWGAFLIGIIGVTLAAAFSRPDFLVLAVVIPLGFLCWLLGCLFPIYFGNKLRRQCELEPENWDAS